jgi:hypothetical protein
MVDYYLHESNIGNTGACIHLRHVFGSSKLGTCLVPDNFDSIDSPSRCLDCVGIFVQDTSFCPTTLRLRLLCGFLNIDNFEFGIVDLDYLKHNFLWLPWYQGKGLLLCLSTPVTTLLLLRLWGGGGVRVYWDIFWYARLGSYVIPPFFISVRVCWDISGYVRLWSYVILSCLISTEDFLPLKQCTHI